MFSVIIPLYNKASYIENAIESVFSQSCKSFELIIVNDGSTDNGLDIVTKIKSEKYPEIVIIDQPNKGVSSARNNGVKSARYEYIVFLDADDWWENSFLEEMKNLIIKFPDGGIYGSSYYIVKNNSKKVASIGISPDFDYGVINYFQVYSRTLVMPLTSISVVIPKKIFIEEKGFKKSLKLGEDFDLWLRIALKYDVVFINMPLANYNQDVDVYNRGVAKDKIFLPESYITFNLSPYKSEELKNQDLKILLDKMRVLSLSRYRYQNAYKQEVMKVISEVDFQNVDRYYYYLYNLPYPVIKAWHLFLKAGMYIKQKLK